MLATALILPSSQLRQLSLEGCIVERPPRKPRPLPENTLASRRSPCAILSRGSIIVSRQSRVSSAGSEAVGSRSSMRSSIRSRGTIVGPRGTPTPSGGASEKARKKHERQGEEAAAPGEQSKEEKEENEEEEEEEEEEEAPLVLEPVLRPLILYMQRARNLDTLGLRDLTPPVDDDLVHDGGLAKALYVNSSIQRLQLDGNALTMKGGVDRLGEASPSPSSSPPRHRRVARPTLLAPPIL